MKGLLHRRHHQQDQQQQQQQQPQQQQSEQALEEHRSSSHSITPPTSTTATSTSPNTSPASRFNPFHRARSRKQQQQNQQKSQQHHQHPADSSDRNSSSANTTTTATTSASSLKGDNNKNNNTKNNNENQSSSPLTPPPPAFISPNIKGNNYQDDHFLNNKAVFGGGGGGDNVPTTNMTTMTTQPQSESLNHHQPTKDTMMASMMMNIDMDDTSNNNNNANNDKNENRQHFKDLHSTSSNEADRKESTSATIATISSSGAPSDSAGMPESWSSSNNGSQPHTLDTPLSSFSAGAGSQPISPASISPPYKPNQPPPQQQPQHTHYFADHHKPTPPVQQHQQQQQQQKDISSGNNGNKDASPMAASVANFNLPTVSPTPPPNIHTSATSSVATNTTVTAAPTAPAPSATPSAPSTEPAYTNFRPTKRYCLSDFIFYRTLGTGSYGRVHLVQSPHNGRFFAIKVMRKSTVVQRGQAAHVLSERQLLSRIRHPFIMTLWGTFQDAKHLFLCTDFIPGGELFSLLHQARAFPESVAKFYAAELALALDYLHVNNVIYRDLKPENVLLAADGHVKLVDFGFAKYVPDITHTLCGTPEYLAPEVIASKGYNKSVDWYAFGVFIYELLAGYTPFAGKDREKDVMTIYKRINVGHIEYPNHFSMEAKDLVAHLVIGDLSKRYGNLANGSNDIFYHPWFAYVDWPSLYYKKPSAPFVPVLNRPGDDRNFAKYPEADTREYGEIGSDDYGGLFKDF